jgi:hypothetical protein
VRVVGTGAQASLTMRKLPVPPTPVGTGINAIALSPDGAMLAVATNHQTTTDFSSDVEVLRVYSVATGAVLHTWTSGPGRPKFGGVGYFGGDDNTSLAWVGNQALAYYRAERIGTSPDAGVMVLDISHPDGDLVDGSRLAASVPFDMSGIQLQFGCGSGYRSDIVITGDGTTFVCGGEGASTATLPTLRCYKGPASNTVGFAGYSLATGKLTRFLAAYKTACGGYALENPYPLWVNATGSTLIGYIYLGGGRQMFGVFSLGSFKPLPIPVPGNWYQYMAGSMIGQIVF